MIINKIFLFNIYVQKSKIEGENKRFTKKVSQHPTQVINIIRLFFGMLFTAAPAFFCISGRR